MPCVVLQPSSARARLDYDCDSRSAWPRAVYFTKSRDDENERTPFKLYHVILP